ncbi:MAG: PAS domain-containing sensor histidine kinase [Terrisporobacter sp.]|uniref:sensor histidine kinase n=1 Tax=Terrisporobacter sp. TaxID=1965305 RepID=UPI002FCAC97C
MYEVFFPMNILSISLFFCSGLAVYTGIEIGKINKKLGQLLLIITIFSMKLMHFIKQMNTSKLVNQYYEGFFMMLVSDMLILILAFIVCSDKKTSTKDKTIITIDYMLCLLSFYLSFNGTLEVINDLILIILLVLNIIYFFKEYSKVIQGLSLFYIINIIFLLETDSINVLILSNSILDLLVSIFMFVKLITLYIYHPYSKYQKIWSNIRKSNINIKLYDEKLNNYRIENKLLKEDLYVKENNLHVLLGQFNKSALLIDNNNYILNQDIVFQSMFPQYKDYSHVIKLDIFLQENIVEIEKFIKSIEKVKYMNEVVTTEITGKDGRIFEAVFSNYDEHNPQNIICILSDISYENRLMVKTEESDIKYKKIAKNIPYSIILEKNKEIIYNNNNLDVNLDNVKNIILNNATKGELNYTDDNGDEITLYVDRIEFMEGEDKLSLIETKDITNHKNILGKLEMLTDEYKTLIDIIPEAICVLDYESKEFEYANNTFYNLFKIQDIESIDFDEIYNDIAISSGNINESIKYIRKTLKDSYGGIINIESCIVLIEIDRSTKMVLIMRDITEEIKVESMKKEIEESKLINKDIDDFFINMSHELLTPVNLLKTSNQFIERMCKGVIDRDPEGEFANCISIVGKHVDILATLIDKIMELSKLENNYHRDSKDIYDIVSICEDIVTEVNKYTIYKGVNIVFDTEKEELFCEIDPNNIGKVILTLLSYVVKYSRIKSTIYFNVKTKGDKSIITIENIKRYDYKKHFDKYEEKILQLSMSIAKLIVNLYKGKIMIKNKDEDSILIEIELNIEKNIKEYVITDKGIDEEFILKEYKKLCDL